MKRLHLIVLLSAVMLSGCGWITRNPVEPEKPTVSDNGNKDDNDNDNDNDNKGEVKPLVTVSKGVKVGDHYLVDMGEAGEWATYNVGAKLPEEAGDLFAWGETKPKPRYDWDTYLWVNKEWSSLTNEENSTVKFTRYNYVLEPGDNNYYLLPEDDAATANWGKEYKTPTHLEWKRLFETCSPRFIRYKESAGFGIESIDGMLFTAKNGNTLFVPCSRSKSYDYISPRGLGEYWSSALANGIAIEFIAGGELQQIPYRDNMAFYMYFTEDMADCTEAMWRCTGMPVRAVRRLPDPEPEPEPQPQPQPPLIVN